ncbi:MAG: hypothetical protein U0Q15_14260 [Kineosporiaceae bacterium]
MLSERHRPRVRRALAVLGVVGAAVSSVALAPVATAAAAPIVSDGFSHAMKTGWGSANVGGDWKIYPRKKFAEITDGVAALRLRGADTGVEAIATGAAVRDVSGTFDFALSKASQGSVFVSFIARRTAASDVRVRVGMAPGGALTVSAAAREGTVERLVASPVTLSGQTFTAGAVLRLEVVVTGAPTTTLKARLYAPRPPRRPPGRCR